MDAAPQRQERSRKVQEAWLKQLSKLSSPTLRQRQNKSGDGLFKGNHEDKQGDRRESESKTLSDDL